MAINKKYGEGLTDSCNKLVRCLVDELTHVEDVLDRATFYKLSMGLSETELINVRTTVKKQVLNYYEKVTNLPASETTIRLLERELKHWFRPWTRLAGAIENEIDNRMSVRLSSEQLDEKFLSSVLLNYLQCEEYKPYLDREFKGFVSNKCLEFGLDYSKMNPTLIKPGILSIWERDFPYLMDSKEWDILSMAYNAGNHCKMQLLEKPVLSNGFIGDKVSWNSFLKVPLGPTFEVGKVTGLGQIDYQGCTNVFVIIGNSKKALPFDVLSKKQKHLVLERVFDAVRFSKCNELEKMVVRKDVPVKRGIKLGL